MNIKELLRNYTAVNSQIKDLTDKLRRKIDYIEVKADNNYNFKLTDVSITEGKLRLEVLIIINRVVEPEWTNSSVFPYNSDIEVEYSYDYDCIEDETQIIWLTDYVEQAIKEVINEIGA